MKIITDWGLKVENKRIGKIVKGIMCFNFNTIDCNITQKFVLTNQNHLWLEPPNPTPSDPPIPPCCINLENSWKLILPSPSMSAASIIDLTS